MGAKKSKLNKEVLDELTQKTKFRHTLNNRTRMCLTFVNRPAGTVLIISRWHARGLITLTW